MSKDKDKLTYWDAIWIIAYIVVAFLLIGFLKQYSQGAF